MTAWQPLLAGSVLLIITAALVYMRRRWTAALAVWAVKYFRSALRLRPDMAEVHGDLGVALCGQGETSECIEQYREALRLKPGLSVVQNNLGIALASEGRFDEAVPHFEEALRIVPYYVKARSNLDAVLRSRQAVPARPQ